MFTSREHILNITKKLKPSFRYDFSEDFNVWQKRAKEKLTDILGLPLEYADDDCFTFGESYEKDGIEFKRFVFQSEPGYFVPCCLVKKKETTKAPLVICLQGHSPGMYISLGEVKKETDIDYHKNKDSDFAVQAAKHGFVAIAVEQRYMGDVGYTGEPWKGPACVAASGDSGANEAMAALLIGRCAIGERVWDVSRTIDLAEKRFADICDTSKIICLGTSGGGTATLYASAVEDRISLSIPSCSVCTFESSIMSVNHCPCNFVPGVRKYFDMGDLACLIAPRGLIIPCGDEDPIFPYEGVKECYNIVKNVYDKIGIPDKCKLVVGNGGHKFYKDLTWNEALEMF